jgi:glucose-6-phosphate isomerase
MEARIADAFSAMAALEAGAVANPSEKRRVGHYWLRAPALSPDAETRGAIESAAERVRTFASDVHSGKVKPQKADRFKQVLLVGIGGSALGPQLVADALGSPRDPMRIHFLDNTDPDGFRRVFDTLGDALRETLTIVISKSGETKETRNGMLETKAAYAEKGLDFARHAVAVTQEGKALAAIAEKEGWLRRFPMWDWVGGRTSLFSAVGLLPARLQGIDTDGLLEGARLMDEATRKADAKRNPAMLMALAWNRATEGRGSKDMVVLPYKDRLVLLPRYLQQLIMESLGKEKDRDENTVHQGISVYGNKGSTDQHSFVQQLRDGVPNFFVTFVQVLRDAAKPCLEVESRTTSGDYLLGFLLGTRDALYAKSRESITLALDELSPKTLGALIALFERTVGFYASLVSVNAYDQPGVQAGKIAAGRVLEIQTLVLDTLASAGSPLSADEVASRIGAAEEVEIVYKVLEHLAANDRLRIERRQGPATHRFSRD